MHWKMASLIEASTTINEIIQDANVIILAVPVGSIVQIIRNLPTIHPEDAIVMDIGSTKREMIAALKELPDQFDANRCASHVWKRKSDDLQRRPDDVSECCFCNLPHQRIIRKCS